MTENNEVTKSYFVENLRNKIYNKQEYVTDNNDMVINFIRNNDSLLKSDDNALLFILKKILPRSKMIREIYTYELLNYNPLNKIDDIDILINIVLKEMHRYQGLIGGFYLEDVQWIKCDTFTRFKPKENQRAVYNSISKRGCCDRDFLTFLKNFVLHIKKFIKNELILVNNKIIDDDDNDLCWILIVCEKKI
jgi:hypothetical protein